MSGVSLPQSWEVEVSHPGVRSGARRVTVLKPDGCTLSPELDEVDFDLAAVPGVHVQNEITGYTYISGGSSHEGVTPRILRALIKRMRDREVPLPQELELSHLDDLGEQQFYDVHCASVAAYLFLCMLHLSPPGPDLIERNPDAPHDCTLDELRDVLEERGANVETRGADWDDLLRLPSFAIALIREQRSERAHFMLVRSLGDTLAVAFAPGVLRVVDEAGFHASFSGAVSLIVEEGYGPARAESPATRLGVPVVGALALVLVVYVLRRRRQLQ